MDCEAGIGMAEGGVERLIRGLIIVCLGGAV